MVNDCIENGANNRSRSVSGGAHDSEDRRRARARRRGAQLPHLSTERRRQGQHQTYLQSPFVAPQTLNRKSPDDLNRVDQL